MSGRCIATVVILAALLATPAHAAPYGRAFHEAASHIALTEGRDLLALARAALEAAVRGEALPDVSERDGEPAPFGVFVTVVRKRKVRGCYGRMEPGAESLSAMIVDAAHGAARLDIRNTPIMPAELAHVEIIVSLVGPTEPIETIVGVNPLEMGLLVRAGPKAAVLLPGEARSARWQLAESRRKAGIGPGEPVQMFRFPTVTLSEHDIVKGDEK